MNPGRSARSIVEHLSSGLDPRAAALLDPSATSDVMDDDVHTWLHHRISGAVRTLRSELPGIPVHAACCRLEAGCGVLIVGHTGSGKSTLVLTLARTADAAIVSDDTVWLEGTTATSVGAPIAVRDTSPWWGTAEHLWYARPGARLLVRPDDLGLAPMQSQVDVDVIVFPRFGQSAGASPIAAATAFCMVMESVLDRCNDESLLALATFVASRPIAAVSYQHADEAVSGLTDVLTWRVDPEATMPSLVTRILMDREGIRPDVCGIDFGDGDVALVSRAVGQTVLVAGWHEGAPLGDDVRHQLAEVGLVSLEVDR